MLYIYKVDTNKIIIKQLKKKMCFVLTEGTK